MRLVEGDGVTFDRFRRVFPPRTFPRSAVCELNTPSESIPLHLARVKWILRWQFVDIQLGDMFKAAFLHSESSTRTGVQEFPITIA